MKTSLLIIAALLAHFAQAQEPRLVLPVGHTLAVNCVAYSPNGKHIITGGNDNNAIIWDVPSGRMLHLLKGHTEKISSVQFSPDGLKVVTASLDNMAGIWDAVTGKLIAVLKPSNIPDPFKSNVMKLAAISQGGKYIVTASTSPGVVVWDAQTFKKKYEVEVKYGGMQDKFAMNNKQLFVPNNKSILCIDIETGKQIFSLEGHTGSIQTVSSSNDGKLLLSSDNAKNTIVWDLLTNQKKYSIPNDAALLETLQFSPNTKYLFASNGYKVTIYHAANGNKLFDINEKSINLKASHFSANGKYFITSPNNGTVHLWDLQTGKLLKVFTADAAYGLVECAAFSPNSNYLLTAGWDRAAHIWDIETGIRLHKLSGHTLYANSVEFSHDGKYYVTASDDSTARIVDATTGANIVALKGHMQHVLYSQFSADGKYVLTVSKDATAIIWENGTGKLLHRLKGHKALIFRGTFNADASKIVTASNDKTAKVWDVKTGSLLLDLKSHTDEVWNAHFSHDGKKIVTASMDGSAIIWDAVTGSKLFILSDKQGPVTDAVFSKNDQKVIITGEFKEPIVWDANTGKGLFVLGGHKQPVYAAAFSNNNQWIVTGARDGTAGIWNDNTGAFIKELKGHTNQISSIQFSHDDQFFVTASQDKNAIVWNTATAQQMQVLKGHNDFVRTAAISPDGMHVLTASEDNTIKQWNIQKKQLDYTRIQLDVLDYLVQSPTGYYLSSPDAAKKLHYVTNDLKVISFEQFDIKYNRPDIVLKRIKPSDSGLINSYHKAFVKRIQKLGIDTAQFQKGFQVPYADFVNRSNILYHQSTNKLVLKINANDSSYKLNRLNVWVNEVPVFGLKGVGIKLQNSFDTTLSITLSQGENRIEMAVTNINGTESYKMPLFVKYAPQKPKETKLHFIGIGINQFSNPDYNLNWSVKDIRDLSLKLKSKYPNIIIDTLFDKNVTKENILALKQKLLLLNEDDKVIVSYSGHGVLSKDFDYYLSTYSINFNNPVEKGLAYDDLESLLDNIKPRQKLMLIDACHSGEVDKEEIAKIESAKAELSKSGITTKSTIKVVPKKNIGMANSFELMQSLFVNVGKGTGATIISAAGGMQYAQERGDLKNGVFTYSIIEAFNNNPSLKVSELKKIVGARVTQLTNGLQKPTSRNETNNYDWIVW